VTHQRQAVYEAVLGSREHPDAEEIFRVVKASVPTISRGTVYRTLETLRQVGLVTDVSRARGTARFEAALEPHHHLVCLGCNKIMDLHDESLNRLRVAPPVDGAFEVTGYQIQFVGYCRSCRSRKTKPQSR
jgi:Fur family peroxide stress response transcriptional regulator